MEHMMRQNAAVVGAKAQSSRRKSSDWRRDVFSELAVRNRGGPSLYPSPGWGMDRRESFRRARAGPRKEVAKARSENPKMGLLEAQEVALTRVYRSMKSDPLAKLPWQATVP
jgi:hypothetical protein